MKFLTLLLLACSFSAWSQTDSTKVYTTAFLQGAPPVIDGKGEDEAWNQVDWGGGNFTQMDPDAGAPATVQTKFKILYDARNLYVLVKNYDPDPSKIVSRMSRRDGFEGDWVEINIDSYYDKRTAFSFTSSVSGVKGDEYVSNNGDNWDASWDPIWYLDTSIDAEGWIAEFRIPLSQLRFADKPEHVWGIQVTRRFFRKQERSCWQYIPPNAGGWVHLFGELRGIHGIRPQRQLEIQPYVVTKTERFQKEEGNPFATGKLSTIDGGLDAKIGLTSDITLDLTVNPDFGQVEADPSQVNLTAFELYFQERRPFFIEGNNVLSFPVNDFSSANLFYSRRVGRPPQGTVDTDPHGEDHVDEYVKPIGQTTILGAAKITGKNKNGFSWGILESVTAEEKATIDSLGHRRRQTVEPLTNYFIARAQQDINKGNTLIGGMFTATNRRINDDHLSWLHDKAYSGGIDFMHMWKERKYYVSARALMSYVHGTAEAITLTQSSPGRFFQRPDNHHATLDSTRRSLTGTGGMLIAGKRSGKLVFDFGMAWQSPELELNDVGYMSQTDILKQWLWIGYRIQNPTEIFRSQRYNFNQWENMDFDVRSTARGVNVNTHFQFKNYWSFSHGLSYETHTASNADLRGGPRILYPGSTNYWFYVGSDNRKKMWFNFNAEWQWGDQNYIHSSYFDVGINYVPINSLRISVTPSVSHSVNQMQYVTTESFGDETRYIVGEIDQAVVRVSFRATFMITPNLSIQYWGQPFGASGKYSRFKYISNSDAAQFTNRFVSIAPEQLISGEDGYEVDEDTDGNADYSIGLPDFNFGQFRSNMVLRWEYIPGSTFFLVWTQEMNGAFSDNNGAFHQRYAFNFDQKAHNIFLMKFTYRWVR
jgi:hypothetical protein